MNINEDFELVFYFNLSTNQNSRFQMEARLEELGIVAERFPVIHGNLIQPRYISRKATDIKWQYARYLTMRLALREARRRGAKSVCFLEDDVIFHPNFTEILKTVGLPEDWGIFHFGSAHEAAPEWVEGRVVRLKQGLGSHAFAVHEREYNHLLKLLRRAQVRGADYGMDRILAGIQAEIPSYGCYPNLAWPTAYIPKDNGKYQGEYLRDGMQKYRVEGLSAILAKMADSQVDCEVVARDCGTVNKVAFLFLTQGDLNHPDLWAEYFSGYEDKVVILSHAKFPKRIKSAVLKDTVIEELVDTKWGEISLVRATRNLLLNALGMEEVSHFILLSESCVPVQPLGALLKKLKVDPRSRFRYASYDWASPIQKSRAQRIREIPVGCWIFQPQWWLLDRKMALFAALPDFTHLFEDVVAADEMYFGTVLSYQGIPLEGNVVNQALTWTWWEQNAGSPNAWKTLEVKKYGRGVLEDLVNSGTFFARKFPQGADVGKYHFHVESGIVKGVR